MGSLVAMGRSPLFGKISVIMPLFMLIMLYSLVKPTQKRSPHQAIERALSGTESSFTSAKSSPAHSKMMSFFRAETTMRIGLSGALRLAPRGGAPGPLAPPRPPLGAGLAATARGSTENMFAPLLLAISTRKLSVERSWMLM